ncbi:MAG: hypothetical protein ACRDHZ_16550 [Ktedonobacteraceae bacterium]
MVSTKIGRFLVMFIFMAVACFSLSALSTPHAYAVGSCGGTDNSCSGQDPVATNCSDNTVHASEHQWLDQDGDGQSDEIDDVFSTDSLCQTNWPRAIIFFDSGLFENTYDVTVTREASNGLGFRFVDGGSVVDCGDGCWGNMVYAPTQLTEACINGTSNHLNGQECANFLANGVI